MSNETLPKVSAVCPTYGREQYGARLYDVFKSQTYENKELLILDDSDNPSSFFSNLNDPKVRYHHTTFRSPVGTKRNWLAEKAEGQILAHFDDDDYYAPNYISAMVTAMGESDLVKLSGFYIFSVTHQTFAYWDLNQVIPLHFRFESMRPIDIFHTKSMQDGERELWQLKNLLGYGFSCVYRKTLWRQIPFTDASHGEDFNFIEAAMKAGASVKMPTDKKGLALVMRHATDNSIVYPQYLLPLHTLESLLGPRGRAYAEQAAAYPS